MILEELKLGIMQMEKMLLICAYFSKPNKKFMKNKRTQPKKQKLWKPRKAMVVLIIWQNQIPTKRKNQVKLMTHKVGVKRIKRRIKVEHNSKRKPRLQLK